jgi:ABC-type Fe3+-hydroxamate transport system substrate-binding protein
VSGIVDMVVKVGLVTGAFERSQAQAAALLRRLAAIQPLPARPKVYVEIDLGGPTTFGASSYLTDALAYVGARNLFADQPYEWSQPDFAEVRHRDPDVILYEAKMYAPLTQEVLLARLRERGWSDLRAVKEGNIVLTPGPLDFLAHHGPSFIRDVLPWLGEHLAVMERA